LRYPGQNHPLKRRAFIALIGGAAASWPLSTCAQQRAKPTIGFLGSESQSLWTNRLSAFRQGLAETGYAEGQNLTIEFRWAQGRNDRLPALAADLVRHQVTMIVTPGSSPAALAAKTATSTIPIVFTIGTDPVATGLVRSLARPEGNVTGVTVLAEELGPKKLELLHELLPKTNILGLLEQILTELNRWGFP
jgi:putative tryptophan/tyrosine transport system substrate-binding protein